MSNATPRGWNEAAWSWAKKQWLAGVSAKDVAKGLGEMGWPKTRSAVIGAMDRYKVYRNPEANRVARSTGSAKRTDRGQRVLHKRATGSTNFSERSEVGHLSELRQELTLDNPFTRMPKAKAYVPRVEPLVRPSSPFTTCQWERCEQPTEVHKGRRGSYCACHASVVYRRTA